MLPSRLLARERLLSQLDAARFYRLTLLSASAGWGKTTLLSTWASRSTFPIAWFSLDELDNDPIPFLGIGACRTADLPPSSWRDHPCDAPVTSTATSDHRADYAPQ